MVPKCGGCDAQKRMPAGKLKFDPQVAAEIWPSGPWGHKQLKGLAKGGRSEVHRAVAICEWLGRSIQSFEHETMF